MTEKDNPRKSFLDPEKVAKEPDFFSREERKEGATTVMGKALHGEKCSMEDIISAIKTVKDPEIPINLYDLGLIYNIEIKNDNEAHIEITLTSPNCPVAESLPKMVKENINSIEEVKKVELKLVWNPPWTKDMMSEEAKLELNL